VLKGVPDALLDTYEEERMPVAANVLGISTKLHRQIVKDVEENVRRDAVTLQLGITYKEMSLSVTPNGVSTKISSGDRAPDAPGLDAEGKSVRLFDFFRGPHFSLLRLFAGDGNADIDGLPRGVKFVDVTRVATKTPAERAFVDAFGHVAGAYGEVNGEFLLVRPDGYVGWIGLRNNFADLHRYLRRVAAD
jgi:hypothetical protein